MIKKFVIEIKTENEENHTTAKDIHLALVKYFVSGVHIHVEEAAGQSVHVDECPVCRGDGLLANTMKTWPCPACKGIRQ
jgi:hypothetical protein